MSVKVFNFSGRNPLELGKIKRQILDIENLKKYNAKSS